MSSKPKIERFVAQDVNGAVWLRLKRLTSSQICSKIIKNNHPGLPDDVYERKSSGMSSAVRSAIGYWETKNGGLNSQILSRYYALLQISLAEQISSKEINDDLKSVQKHTESGHGLYTYNVDGENFPDNIKIGCLKGGHFYAYAKSIGVNIKDYASERRPRNEGMLKGECTYSLTELLARIPELRPILKEVLNKEPLSFQIGLASRNMIERSKNRVCDHYGNLKEIAFPGFTYVAIYPKETEITAGELNSFCFEIKEIESERKENLLSGDNEYFVGKLYHPEGTLWWDYIKTYKSGYCGSSVIVPFWGVQDPLILHLIVLYALSIIVRYLPDTWHEIEHGELEHFYSLLENYLVIFDSIMPKIAVERLTNVILVVTSPDSMNSPI